MYQTFKAFFSQKKRKKDKEVLCPVCRESPELFCHNCPLKDVRCPNKHWWHINKEGKIAIGRGKH
jgi:hypothetical protein